MIDLRLAGDSRSCDPWIARRIHARPPPQLLEVQHDGLVRPEQIRDDFLTGSLGPAAGALVFEKRPEPLTNVGRQHAFEVFEGGSAQSLVVGVEGPERRSQRLGGQDEARAA
jgi:hypothetical protein